MAMALGRGGMDGTGHEESMYQKTLLRVNGKVLYSFGWLFAAFLLVWSWVGTNRAGAPFSAFERILVGLFFLGMCVGVAQSFGFVARKSKRRQ